MKKYLTLIFVFLLSFSFAYSVPGNGLNYYPLNDDSQSDDWSGLDMTINDGANYVTSWYADYNLSGNGSTHSMDFDGTDDGVYYNNYNNISSTDYSLSFWAKSDVAQANEDYDCFVRWGDATASNMMIYFSGYGDNTIRFRAYDSGYTTQSDIDYVQNLGQSQHHYVFVVSDTDNKIYAYIDGAKVDESAMAFTPRLTSEPLYFGRRDTSFASAEAFNGKIDEIQIFNKQLDITDIQNLYNYGDIDGYSPPVANNFTIIATSNYNASSINEFEAYFIDRKLITDADSSFGNTIDTYKLIDTYVNTLSQNIDIINGSHIGQSVLGVGESKMYYVIEYSDTGNFTTNVSTSGKIWKEFTYNVPSAKANKINKIYVYLKDVYSDTFQNGDIFIENVDYYNTTTGTITTDILDNNTNLFNITLIANNYNTKIYSNTNVSSNLNATLDQYPFIEVKNIYDNSNISNYNITINSIEYDNQNNPFYINVNNTYQVLVIANGFSNSLQNLYLPYNGNNTMYIYQVNKSIYLTEIGTGNQIQNWSFYDGYNTYSTTNNLINYLGNSGTFSWNITNEENYYNFTNKSVTLTNGDGVYNITNLFAMNLSFYDNISSSVITPTCSLDSINYSAYNYYMHKSTNTISCIINGFEDRNFTISSFPNTSSWGLQPVSLFLNFSENTSGIIMSGETFVRNFSGTSVYWLQKNITNDYVKIEFNLNGDKYEQLYVYYNDNDTTIKEDILVQTNDLVQQVRVTGNSQALVNARVCSKFPINEQYLTTYCDFTSSTGDVSIRVNDENTYLFCVQKDGFTPKCQLETITPSNQETITIDLASEISGVGSEYIKSSCGNTYLVDTNCLMEVVTHKPYYSICVNNTVTKTNYTNSTETCVYDSTGETFLYSLSKDFDKYELSVYLNGNLAKTIIHNNVSDPSTILINYNSGNSSNLNIRESMEANTELLTFMYFVFLILGVLAGYMFDNYFNGYGVYGSGLWFMFLGMGGFYLFYIPSIIIGFYFITERIIPLFKN